MRKVLKVGPGEKFIISDEEITPKKAEKKDKAGYNFATEIGFSLALPLAGGALLGKFIDEKMGSGSQATLTLIFLGLFIGISNIVLLVKKYTDA